MQDLTDEHQALQEAYSTQSRVVQKLQQNDQKLFTEFHTLRDACSAQNDELQQLKQTISDLKQDCECFKESSIENQAVYNVELNNIRQECHYLRVRDCCYRRESPINHEVVNDVELDDLRQECFLLKQECNRLKFDSQAECDAECDDLREQCDMLREHCDYFYQLTRELRESQPIWIIQRSEIVVLDTKLGRGAYSWVKEATFCGCKVAVKCLYNIVVSDKNFNIFSREMNKAARFRHPNLLQFIGATADTYRPPLVVTELMHTSLRRVLEQNKLASDQILPILLGVACGLNFLHKNSPPILHRNISSSNVLLNPLPNNQWSSKLADFGSFNFMLECHTINTSNPAYAAPEAIRGLQTPAMDVFSFGVLMHEMCTRRQPSRPLTVTTVNQQSTPERDLVAIITCCTEVNIPQRCNMDYVIAQLNVLACSD